MPRLGANWDASVSSGRRTEHDLAELTDAALAGPPAGRRAIEAVGPELSGVLIDVCCFLKGIEVVEIGARLAGSIGQDRVEDRAWRAEPPLRILPHRPPSRQSRRALHWEADRTPTKISVRKERRK